MLTPTFGGNVAALVTDPILGGRLDRRTCDVGSLRPTPVAQDNLPVATRKRNTRAKRNHPNLGSHKSKSLNSTLFKQIEKVGQN